MENQEIRFNEKKVDEAWKDEIRREKRTDGEAKPARENGRSNRSEQGKLSEFFMSLAMQALMCLGEIENPQTKTKTQDLQAAKEIIDLLVLLQQKTNGNLTKEEERSIASLIPELQMKFVSLSST